MKMLRYLILFLFVAGGVAEAQNDRTAGIGVVLGVEGQYVVIKRILPDSPAAAQQGVHVGGRITAIGQGEEPPVRVHNGELRQAVELIRGVKGTKVRLTLFSAGEDISRARVVSFTRGEIQEFTKWGDGVLLTNGTKAPDIEMSGLTTKASERLSDYGGKIIVLEFWASWCGPCQPRMAELQGFCAKYPEWKTNAVVIAASVDDEADIAAKHVKVKGWDRTHNVWVGTEARKAYHIDAVPTVYVIGKRGKIEAVNPTDIPEAVNGELEAGNPKPEARNPNTEIRRPKEGRDPKSETH